ncbi:MAG: cytochrome-c oxidase [Phycisphaerae bacterium]|nr:cytochrome-c oxidase [Phycisphaerae bacterium]
MSDDAEQTQVAKPHHPPIPPGLYVKVWIALVLLTGVTVTVSYLDMQKFTVFTAMLIATVKASLVLLYFMHIRFEKVVFQLMILFTLIIYAIFIFLTFADYSYR